MGSSPLSLDVEALRTWLAVLDHGGMTKAAERLDMTQSAVSWRIKRLEARVGRPLLIRDRRSLLPSRDGRALLDDARALVDIHDRASSRLQNSDLTGTVKLGSNEEVDPARMASMLGRFRRTHPGASIEFLIDYTENLIRRINRGEIDVAIIQVVDDYLLSTDTVLWTDQLRWVTSRERATDDDEVVPLVTFGDLDFYRSLSEPHLVDANIEYKIGFSASSIAGHRAAIAAGLGVAVLESRHLGGEIVDWPRAASLPELPIVHQIARTVRGEALEVTKTLTEAIVDELRDPPPDR